MAAAVILARLVLLVRVVCEENLAPMVLLVIMALLVPLVPLVLLVPVVEKQHCVVLERRA